MTRPAPPSQPAESGRITCDYCSGVNHSALLSAGSVALRWSCAYRATEWSHKLDYGDDYLHSRVSNKGAADYTLEVAVY